MELKQLQFIDELGKLGDKELNPKVLQKLKSLPDKPVTPLYQLFEIAEDQEQRDLRNFKDKLDGFARKNTANLYSVGTTRELSGYIADQRAAALSRDYFSARVLDDSRGEYALYQAVYITCVVILVFGLLYPFYLLLRLLPPFAVSLDPLTDQAKQIISGRRDVRGAAATLAAPAIAKTLALSVAAVGIGTTVAVANSGSNRQKEPEQLAASESVSRPNPRRKEPNEEGSSSTTPADDARIAALESTLTQVLDHLSQSKDPTLGLEVARLRGEFESLNKSTTDLGSQVSTLKERTGDIDFKNLDARTKGLMATDVPWIQQIPDLKKNTDQLVKTDVPRLDTGLKEFKDKANLVEKDLFAKLDESAKRLDLANNQILGARFNDSGNPSRSFFSRFNVFASNRYMVTYQSYRIMENLMCEQPVGLTGALNPAKCKDSSILAKMKEQVGQPPVSESQLLATLGATSSAWKNQILRFTRVPN